MRIAALVLLLASLAARPLPGQSQGALEAADKLVGMKRYHEALAAIEKAIAKMPDDPGAYAIQGKALFHLSRFQEAKATFEKVRRMEPRYDEWTAPFLARIAFWYGDDAEARTLLAKVPDSEFVAHGLPVLLDPPDMGPTKSEHYIVYVDEGLRAKEAGPLVAANMELVHATYSKVLPFDTPGVLNRVYLFSDRAKFDDFVTRLVGKSLGRIRSHYSENYRAIVINAAAEGAPVDEYGLPPHAYESMFHTGFSQFRHLHVPALPDWFEKGMGAYFEGTQVKGKKVTVGQFPKTDPRGGGHLCRYEIVKKCLADESFLPLSALLTVPDDDFNDKTNNRSLINGAHSWCFVHFLLHAPSMKTKGKKLLGSYFTLMSKGSSREEAFSQTFGKVDLDALQEELLGYARGL